MNKKLFYPILLLFVFSNCSLIGDGTKNYKTNTDIIVSGKVVIQQFENNVSGDPEPGEPAYIDYYVLNLDTPINVLADKVGGPERKVKQIQIAPSDANLTKAINQSVNKSVTVKGELFYANTVYHYTKVLIFCNEILK
jgi:hypothetical protein